MRWKRMPLFRQELYRGADPWCFGAPEQDNADDPQARSVQCDAEVTN